MQAHTRLQAPKTLRINDGSTNYLYEIAHNRQGERLWRESTIKVQPGQGELVKTWDSWHAGMGWSRDETRDAEYAAPVYEAGSATATHRGVLYPPFLQNTITALTGTANRIVEMGSYIYVLSTSGTDIVVNKIDPSDDTIVYSRTFSGWTAPAGQTAEFGGYLYVPSAGGIFKELTTIVGDLTAVWYYDGTNYTNNTTAAAVSGGTAFTLLADHTDDILYFGAATKFDGVYFDIGTAAGSALTMDLEYWNGAWTDMAPAETDGTTGLTVDGWITWTPPADWVAATSAATSMGGTPPDNTSRYWVRVKTSTATPWTAPTANWLPPSDVWTNGPASRTAWHMATAGKLLWRVGDSTAASKHYVVNSCSAISTGGAGGPLTAANWSDSADYVIGKPGRNINSLAELGRWLYVGKEEGVFAADGDGNQTNILDFVRNLLATTNCSTMCRWLGTLVVAHKGALWQHTGASSRSIGIEILDGNLSTTKNGRYVALVAAGLWLYAAYRVAAVDMILAARPGGENEPPIVWHQLGALGYGVEDLLVSTLTSSPRLWFARSTDLHYNILALDGSPNPTDSSVTFSSAASNFDVPAVDWGQPGTVKRGHMVEIVTKQKGTGGSVSVSYSWDGGTFYSLGSAAAGLTRLFWTTAATVRSGYRPQLRIVQTGSGSTGALRVEKVSLYCVARPRKEPALEFTLRLYPGGPDKRKSVEQQWDDLWTLSETGLLTLYNPDDPEGTATYEAFIDTMEESKGEQIERTEGERHVHIVARVIKYA